MDRPPSRQRNVDRSRIDICDEALLSRGGSTFEGWTELGAKRAQLLGRLGRLRRRRHRMLIMDFHELQALACQVRARYDAPERQRFGRGWNHEELMLGVVGDVGDLSKLVQGMAGVRPHADLDAAMAHELADCLWPVLVLADGYNVDLQTAFIDTMATITESLTTDEPRLIGSVLQQPIGDPVTHRPTDKNAPPIATMSLGSCHSQHWCDAPLRMDP
jgi:NTP pyrophosphatase (non-canonical NTP hydrolase)